MTSDQEVDMQPGGLGRKPSPETVKAAKAYPVTKKAGYPIMTAATYKYWWQGGAWLDQGQEGTCVGHAFAHRRADGPVKVEGITHQWARRLYYEASGDETYQQGTSAWAACRVLADRGEIDGYYWARTPDELRNTVLSVGSVCVGTDWYESMFDPVSRYKNKYLKVDRTSRVVGGHEYVINGINLNPTRGKPYYRMKNSWGTSWGKHGTARILAKDLEWLLFERNGDAVIVSEVNP